MNIEKTQSEPVSPALSKGAVMASCSFAVNINKQFNKYYNVKKKR